MRRWFVATLFLTCLLVTGAVLSSPSSLSAAAPAAPTFNKDVLPILQANCQECHRPDAIAPMSFLTYQSTRPYAKAIEKVVVARTAVMRRSFMILG